MNSPTQTQDNSLRGLLGLIVGALLPLIFIIAFSSVPIVAIPLAAISFIVGFNILYKAIN